MARALAQLRKLKYANASFKNNAKTITVKIPAGFFYGIEANDLKENQLARIGAAVIGAFKGSNDNHDIDWFYATSSHEKDLGLVVQIFGFETCHMQEATHDQV